MPDPVAGAARLEMPEFTRSLRGFASARGLGRPEHAAVFGPLLAARKEAQLAPTAGARVAAFDAARLRAAWLSAIESMAAARVPAAGPDRRSLVARLTECAGPVLAALPALDRAGAAMREARDGTEARAWRTWIAAVQTLFDAADRYWFALEPDLGPPPVPPGKKRHGTTGRAS